MKKLSFGLVFLVTIFAYAFTYTGDPSALEIIKKSEEKFRGASSRSTMTMTIIRPSWKRTMTMKTWSLGDDFSMTLVTAPARDKGVAFLKRENEIWNWQPTIDRVIKMPPSMMSQSWMGSDLKNDDLVKQSSIVTDYKHKLVGKEKIEGRLCYKLELIPKPEAAVVWGKVLMWVDVEEFLQMKTEFYDEDDYLTNTIIGTNVKKLGGRTIPTKMIVKPAEEPENQTILEYNEIEFNVKIPNSFFSVQNMKRVR